MAGKFSMNPQRNAHMEQGMGVQPGEEADDVKQGSGQHHPPHIHIHKGHGGKTHVHIMHHDKEDEHHEHDEGDTEGVKTHVDAHYGSGGGEKMEPPEGNEIGLEG